MSEVADVRYDRQIRLWGKSTQQLLMRTDVTFHGIAGVAAEVAKNLSLAGVRLMQISDNGAVRLADRQTNFLMQGVTGTTRQCCAVQALSQLNPFVKVSEGLAPALPVDAATGVAVTVAQISSIAEAEHLLTTAPVVDLFALHMSCGATVCTVFLYKKDTNRRSFLQQWQDLVCTAAALSRMPRGFQQLALLLHLRSGAAAPPLSFQEHLLDAYCHISNLGLHQLGPRDVEEVMQAVTGDAAVDAIGATIAGASVAQHIIRQIGSAHAPLDDEAYRWMVCEYGESIECLVGTDTGRN